MTVTDVFSYNVSNAAARAVLAYFKWFLRSLLTAPVGDRGELQRAERLGAAEGQTDGCSHPSPRRHDAE